MEENIEFRNEGTEQPRLENAPLPPERMDLRQRFEDRFNQVFGEVFQTNAPQISVDIFFSYHNSPKDLEGLSERIKEVDIYIPEAFGWSRRDLGYFRNSSSPPISFPELTRRLSRRPRVFLKHLEDVYNSNKAITIIDVPDRHRLQRESDEVWRYEPPLEGDFPQALAYTKTFLNNLALHHNRREDYMVSQITRRKVEELLGTYPSLRNRQTLGILLSLGMGHAPRPSDYSNYSFTDEGIIRSKFGEEITDELAAKIFLENPFERAYFKGYLSLRDWLTDDSKKIGSLKRLKISNLGSEDAQRLFDYVKGEEREAFRMQFYRGIVGQASEFPQSE